MQEKSEYKKELGILIRHILKENYVFTKEQQIYIKALIDVYDGTVRNIVTKIIEIIEKGEI